MPNSQTRKLGKMPGVEIDPSSAVESVNVSLNSRQIVWSSLGGKAAQNAEAYDSEFQTCRRLTFTFKKCAMR